MSKVLDFVGVNEQLTLRVVTKCPKGESVYQLGVPDKEGYRTIRRNDDPEFVGKIIGPVKRIDQIAFDGQTRITDLDDGRCVLQNFPLTPDAPIAILKKGQSPSSIVVTRPIDSIEVL